MYEDIKVSIIIAVYNSEKFLPQLFNSLTHQTHENLEIIFVNDGSPDNSGFLCDEFALKDQRVKVIHKTNGGACDARNVGLNNITGEYFSVIDGDDWLAPDYVEYLLSLIKKYDSDMSMTDSIFTTRDLNQVDNEKAEVLSNEEAATRILYPNIPVGPWNKLYKTKLIKDNNISFSVPWSGEGLYFSFMAALHSKCVILGHKKIYIYRLNNEESGLTNYNVQMGINALWNIKNIQKQNSINSESINNAAVWHIWKNYNFLLKLIIATNSKSEYRDKYIDCLKNIRRFLPNILLNKYFSIDQRAKFLVQSIIPISFAKRTIRKEKQALLKDLKNL